MLKDHCRDGSAKIKTTYCSNKFNSPAYILYYEVTHVILVAYLCNI